MGMDVTGKSGNYFRASIGTWPNVMAATEAALNKPLPESWHYNDGAGMSDLPGITTDELAATIEAVFFPYGVPEDDETILPVEADPTQLKGTAASAERFLGELMRTLGGEPDTKVIQPTTTCMGLPAYKLAEWCKFLRESGGDFEIW